MLNGTILAACLLLTGPAWIGTAQAEQGDLTISVPNLRADGTLFVAVCTQETFLEDNCPHKTRAEVKTGEGQAVVKGVPAGTYAVQIYADENGDGKLDRNFLGVPREGVGFSRDPSYTFSAPKFADTSFEFDGSEKTVPITLRYW